MGAVKMHTLLSLRGAILAFIYLARGQPLSSGELRGFNVPDFSAVEASAFYGTDSRGHGPRPPRLDIAGLYKMRQAGRFFFTRDKRSMNTSGMHSAKTYRTGAVPSYMLCAIVKNKLHLDASLYTLLQILTVSILILFDL